MFKLFETTILLSRLLLESVKAFWKRSKDIRHRTRKTFINLLLTISVSAAAFVVFTLSVALCNRILPSHDNTCNPQAFSWWINTKYGEALGMRSILPLQDHYDHSPQANSDQSWLDLKDYNYTLTISSKAQWKGPDYIVKYRDLLNEVRNGYHVHRRSHVQELGTRVTCWPEGEFWGHDGGFLSRHVSSVELDWLGLPRFQDTLPSQDQVAEDLFCEKFKQLLPFHYKNGTWYTEILKLDEKHTRAQLLGCEPGFRRTIRGGVVTDVEMVECHKRSPHAFLQKDLDVESLVYLEQPLWALDDWSDWDMVPGPGKWEAGGRIGNALTMEERIKAIESSGGKRLFGKELEKFLGCWYGECKMDCSTFGGSAGYQDSDLDTMEVWP